MLWNIARDPLPLLRYWPISLNASKTNKFGIVKGLFSILNLIKKTIAIACERQVNTRGIQATSCPPINLSTFTCKVFFQQSFLELNHKRTKDKQIVFLVCLSYTLNTWGGCGRCEVAEGVGSLFKTANWLSKNFCSSSAMISFSWLTYWDKRTFFKKISRRWESFKKLLMFFIRK